MNSDRKTARIIGVLYLTALVTGILYSEGFVGPVIDAPDFLVNVYPNRIQVITGILFEMLCAVAVVGIAVMLFPILKKHSETIALGYFGFRIIEAASIVVSAASLLPLLALSQEYIQAGSPDVSSFQTLGTLVVAGHYWVFQMVIVVCGVAGVMLSYLLYRSRLVPRFIAVLGIIGYPLSMAAPLLDMFGYSAGIVLFLPGSLFEIVFPIWLIVKGFNSSAIAGSSQSFERQ